jgi:uncharacterized protein
MPPDTDKRLTMPAGRVFVVVVIALAVAALLNSEAVVRAGEGMKPGTTRDIVLSVGRPLDDVAGTVGFHLPRKGFDVAFGQESKTAEGTELEGGSAEILKRAPAAVVTKPKKPDWRQPTPTRPLNVLVTGDSESQFVGEQMAELDRAGLLNVTTVARNGTGLTNPNFFNWELNAGQEMSDRNPDAVVMVLGGNDGFNVDVDGTAYGPETPQWQTEFARRAAVVMRTLTQNGKRPVYWAAPPTARDETYNNIYRNQNAAVKRAAEAVPGGRYVDIYTTINDGRYSDTVTLGKRKVLGRQSDGVHFNREGAVLPAHLILRAMSKDYPDLKDDVVG